MKLIDLTFEEPAANIAIDEALLDEAESSAPPLEYLRLWSPAQPMVVLGQSGQVNREVHVDFCQRDNIPIFRRCSGGGTIITGPGCLMYAVVISYQDNADLRMIDRAHEYVLGRLRQALRRAGIESEFSGQSDLAVEGRKISGNSMRCKRKHFLYHGTLLYDFDLALIGKALKHPLRQPAYRNQRSHAEFVTNMKTDRVQLGNALIEQFGAQPTSNWPEQRTQALVKQKYSKHDWNFKR